MPITDSRDEGLDTTKDVKRHHDKVKEAVRKKLPEIIAEENIITGDNKGKKIRVPVKSIEIPDLRHGKRSKGDKKSGGQGRAGIGQGQGQKGDVIDVQPGEQPGKGIKGGDGPGEDMIESEFLIEEVIDMMFEDLGLPNVQKKDLSTIEVSLGYKITGSAKVGPMVRLKKRSTIKNAMKTFWVFMASLQNSFKNRTDLDCFAALKKTGGTLHEAEKLLNDPSFKHDLKRVDPFPIVSNDDLRFFNLEEKKTTETNAVVFAILDVSGSVNAMKKYIARAILFWIVQVLRKQYTQIDIRFIVHHESARLVDEKDFFRITEGGGTHGYSAFSIVNELIKDQYPTDLWNVYAFYFSDGEDAESVKKKTMYEMRKMMDSGINMFAFADIKGASEDIITLLGGDIMNNIKTEWPVFTKYVLVEDNNGGIGSRSDLLELVIGEDGFPFLGVTINDKHHVFTVLREFLRKER